MNQRMPCSITDGEQFEESVPSLEDKDTAYERVRQQEIDDDHMQEDRYFQRVLKQDGTFVRPWDGSKMFMEISEKEYAASSVSGE